MRISDWSSDVCSSDLIAFGALAQDAARFNLPPEIPALHPSAPRLVGRSMPRLDTPAKLDGSARFGADVRLPNMVYASVRSGPSGGSRLVSADEKAAGAQIGSGSCRERVCQYVWIAVVGVTIKKKK